MDANLSLVVLLLFYASVDSSSISCVPPREDDCNKCDLTRNPSRYLADPCGCGYFQCVYNQFGGFDVQKMPCPNCTCWDQKKLTCIRDSSADDCSGPIIADAIWKSGDTCQRSNVGYAVTYEKVDGDAQSYYWHTSGGKIKMPCPPGTTFSLDQCGCAFGGHVSKPRPFMCLTFDDDMKPFDTMTGIYVDPKDVHIVSGGVHGKAARFNHSNIEVPAFDNKETPKMSVSLWYKRESFQNDAEALISNDDCATNADPSIQVLLTNNNHVKGAFRTSYGVNQIQTSTSYQDKGVNHWNHIAVVYNGEKMSLYLNGVKKSEETASGFVEGVHCPLLIGSMYGKNYFNGLMDQVCFYDYALSANQVHTLYSVPANVTQP